MPSCAGQLEQPLWSLNDAVDGVFSGFLTGATNGSRTMQLELKSGLTDADISYELSPILSIGNAYVGTYIMVNTDGSFTIDTGALAIAEDNVCSDIYLCVSSTTAGNTSGEMSTTMQIIALRDDAIGLITVAFVDAGNTGAATFDITTLGTTQPTDTMQFQIFADDGVTMLVNAELLLDGAGYDNPTIVSESGTDVYATFAPFLSGTVGGVLTIDMANALYPSNVPNTYRFWVNYCGGTAATNSVEFVADPA